MKILKLFTNDAILILLYSTILIYIDLPFSNQYLILNLSINILAILTSYYLINLIVSFLIVLFLYLVTAYLFNKNQHYTIFKKCGIVLLVFDREYDNINTIHDFQLKVEKYLGSVK